MGLPLRWTDANGATTFYAYDFWPVENDRAPGDSLSLSHGRVRYFDGGDMLLTDRWPLMMDHLSRARLARIGARRARWRRMSVCLRWPGPRFGRTPVAGANWTCNGGGKTLSVHGYSALSRVSRVCRITGLAVEYLLADGK